MNIDFFTFIISVNLYGFSPAFNKGNQILVNLRENKWPVERFKTKANGSKVIVMQFDLLL